MSHSPILALQAVAVLLAAAADPGVQGALGSLGLGKIAKEKLQHIDGTPKNPVQIHMILGVYSVVGTILTAYAEGRLAQLDIVWVAHVITSYISAIIACHANKILGAKADAITVATTTTTTTFPTEAKPDGITAIDVVDSKDGAIRTLD